MAVEITDSNFSEVVTNSDKPVVVDFWAAWCGPCRMVGPLIEEMHGEYDGRAVVGKVDVDQKSWRICSVWCTLYPNNSFHQKR